MSSISDINSMQDRRDRLKIFLSGVRDGFPIGAGYFAVSFSLGIVAKLSGITGMQGFFASFFTMASAGEYAGFMVIRESAGLLQMMLATLVASARYFLMSCALTQRLDPEMPFRHRLFIAYGLTDEIFGVQIARPGYVEPVYTYGLFVLPVLLWSSGTLLGIMMGNLLPAAIVSALSVAIYGMFIAIIVPPARKNRVILGCVVVSFALSFLFSRLPALSGIGSGTKTLILSVLIAGLAAVLFPLKEEPADE